MCYGAPQGSDGPQVFQHELGERPQPSTLIGKMSCENSVVLNWCEQGELYEEVQRCFKFHKFDGHVVTCHFHYRKVSYLRYLGTYEL